MEDKFILFGLERDGTLFDQESSMDELELLVETAGGETVGRVIQKRDSVHPAHYLGKGKIEEVAQLIESVGATGVICDDELSPTQYKNLEKALNTRIFDRTTLILEIFAQRAVSAEGKIQVELARKKYSLNHLVGKGLQLSRIGGGAATKTRGAGETKLETDRRHIRSSIKDLEERLDKIELNRKVLRDSREKNAHPVVSMVGYTNAGKSTLLNKTTDAGVFAEDKLFATLDTTTRKIKLTGGTEILFSDTVGFIQKLPHQLIQAFRATLDELAYADVLVHVVDISNKMYRQQMEAVYETLDDLKLSEKPVITVYNKSDAVDIYPAYDDERAVVTVRISAKTGENIDGFLSETEKVLNNMRSFKTVLIPYSEGKLLDQIHTKCEVKTKEHRDIGVYIEAFMDTEIANRVANYEI